MKHLDLNHQPQRAVKLREDETNAFHAFKDIYPSSKSLQFVASVHRPVPLKL